MEFESTLLRSRTYTGVLAALQEQGIDGRSLATLEQSGARDTGRVLSLLRDFPGLAANGLVDAPRVSFALSRSFGGAYKQMNAAMAAIELEPRRDDGRFRRGARPPANSPWQIGHAVPLDSDATATPGAAYPRVGQTVSLDVRAGLPWPVRYQGNRGTCVAFAVAALVELERCRRGERIDLSEQFLYWAIKTHGDDGLPDQDGTWLQFALAVLASHGIAEEALWEYEQRLDPDNISHGGPERPSAAVLQDALARAVDAGVHVDAPVAAAVPILDLLRQGRAVAVSLPVFVDPMGRGRSNWDAAIAVNLGQVLDPPPTAVMDGAHAVCLTGFAADPDEPAGGYFILRNSWSERWGANLPAPGVHGPEPGYGQVSASYVDRYLLEYAAL